MFGLSNETIAKINSIFQKHKEVEKVVIYGSRAKGNYKTFSDVDITLFGKGINSDILTAIDMEIDDLLLPYTFDMSVYEKISNKDLIAHIDRQGKILYERNTSAIMPLL